MTEQPRAWVARDERRVSPTPTEIPPHPDHGDLPPCEVGSATDRPCPRPAKYHYGYIYCCAEHLAVIQAAEDSEEAQLGVYHARRFLWKAQVEGLEQLEDSIAGALSRAESHRLDMERRLEEAESKADAPAA